MGAKGSKQKAVADEELKVATGAEEFKNSHKCIRSSSERSLPIKSKD